MKLNNSRKQAFQQGLSGLRAAKSARLTRTGGTIGAIRPSLYNPAGMPNTNLIIQGDSIKVLNDGPEGWIDLVFADPPFNIGYLYHGYNDELKTEDYLKFSADWMKAVHRALKPTGSFYLAIGDEYAADLAVIARRQIGFNLRNWIIWHYTFGQQTKKMFAKSHTHILYFTKEKEGFTFNPDSIRVASAAKPRMATSAPTPKVNCRMTPGICARRKPAATVTSNPARTSGTSAESAAPSRNAKAGTAARCRWAFSTESSKPAATPATSSSTPSTAPAPPASPPPSLVANMSASIKAKNTSTTPASGWIML